MYIYCQHKFSENSLVEEFLIIGQLFLSFSFSVEFSFVATNSSITKISIFSSMNSIRRIREIMNMQSPERIKFKCKFLWKCNKTKIIHICTSFRLNALKSVSILRIFVWLHCRFIIACMRMCFGRPEKKIQMHFILVITSDMFVSVKSKLMRFGW